VKTEVGRKRDLWKEMGVIAFSLVIASAAADFSLSAGGAQGTPVSTVQDLINIKNNLAGSFYLTQDIDMQGFVWTTEHQLGLSNQPFTGVLDGAGFRIKNLKADRSFMASLRGAQIRNLTFEAPELGGGVYSSGSLFHNIHQPAAKGANTRIENVHVINGIFRSRQDGSTVGSANSWAHTGGLVGSSRGLEILGSSATVKFFCVVKDCAAFGGLIGSHQLGSTRIENSKARVEFHYSPTANHPFSQNSLYHLGGIIGSVNHGSLEILRSEADFKISVSTPDANFKLNGVAGLTGAFTPQAWPTASTLLVQESSAHVDFQINLPPQWMGQPDTAYPRGVELVSGLLNVRGYSLLNNPERSISVRDSHATGRIQIVGPSSPLIRKIAGAVVIGDYTDLSDQFTVERVYSQVEHILPEGVTAGVRPFLFVDTAVNLSVASNFFNVDSLGSAVTTDPYATAATTVQMYSPSLWLKSGYSDDVWSMPGCALPTLRNISVRFPGEAWCPADIDGDEMVGAKDLALLLANWNQGDDRSTDLNASGLTDGADLCILLSAWGVCE